mgnify:CR=1 FL=1
MDEDPIYTEADMERDLIDRIPSKADETYRAYIFLLHLVTTDEKVQQLQQELIDEEIKALRPNTWLEWDKSTRMWRTNGTAECDSVINKLYDMETTEMFTKFKEEDQDRFIELNAIRNVNYYNWAIVRDE